MKRKREEKYVTPFKRCTLSIINECFLSQNKALINDHCYEKHDQKLYWAIIKTTTDSEPTYYYFFFLLCRKGRAQDTKFLKIKMKWISRISFPSAAPGTALQVSLKHLDIRKSPTPSEQPYCYSH